jgi:hypothetical protein
MAIPDALHGMISGQLRQRLPGLSADALVGGCVPLAGGFRLAELRCGRTADARTIYLWFFDDGSDPSVGALAVGCAQAELGQRSPATDLRPSRQRALRAQTRKRLDTRRHPCVMAQIRGRLGHGSGRQAVRAVGHPTLLVRPRLIDRLAEGLRGGYSAKLNLMRARGPSGLVV